MNSPPVAQPLDVAVAVIERESRYLITQRLENDSFGGWWEFPGGKVNPGESLEAAVAREIQEELGLTIEVGVLLQVIEHRYPERFLRLHCFACRITAGEPKAVECAAWRWVNSKELRRFKFPPASEPLLRQLENGR